MPTIPAMGSVWTAWTDAYKLIFTGTDPSERSGAASRRSAT